MSAGGRSVLGTAAFAVGAAVGIGAAAGTALLLYTGQGFLRAAGFLLAVTILAVAAGLWVGPPGGYVRRGRMHLPWTGPRWLGAVVALALAAAAAALWEGRPALRGAAPAGAAAVLLVLAAPAYAAGALLAALQARARGPERRSAAPAAVAGIATGVLVGTALLIPRASAPSTLLAAAALVAVAGAVEARHLETTMAGEGDTMEGRVVLITGAGDPGQVAQAVAERFAAGGARLVLTGRSEAVRERAAELVERGAEVEAVVADLATDAGAAAVVEAARQRFGALHALVNVAGGLRAMGPLADTRAADWSAEVERNALTALRVSRAALPLLRESGGAIVNFASPAGLRAVKGLGAYSAAKAAVVATTRAMALEERERGVRVNAVAPGLVDTAQNREQAGPGGRFVSREAVAEVVWFLVSDAGRGVSGETVRVLGDGLS